jgi:solute carrier family 35 (UDP-sugar transporter), member A1/2/3
MKENKGRRFKVSIKLTLRNSILLVLCLQNAGFTLLRRYSQGVLKERYDYSSLLLVGEFFKLATSAYMTAFGPGQRDDTDIKHMAGVAKLRYLAINAKKMVMLAGIYGAMNLFSFISLARISAVEFTVASQLKILVTAVFFVILFQRKISATRWRALVLLVCGVILVSNPDRGAGSSSTGGERSRFGVFVGYAAVLIQVCMSGFAAVYFEKVIKSSTERLSIWDRNFQLAGCSIIFYFATYLFQQVAGTKDEGAAPGGGGFFAGWSVITLVLSMLSAGGGILVALTFKHADSILKTLAVSLAMVATTFFSWMLLGAELNITMLIGAVCAMLGVVNYNWDTTPPEPLKPVEEVAKETVALLDTPKEEDRT